MSERERRIGENEALFRSVNEQVSALNATLPSTVETTRIVCECGDERCIEQIQIHAAEYAELREDPTQFAVKPEHDVPDTERVVSRNDRFWVVRKDPGTAAEVARATDPRG